MDFAAEEDLPPVRSCLELAGHPESSVPVVEVTSTARLQTALQASDWRRRSLQCRAERGGVSVVSNA
jgi:hypothetical protein